MVDAVCAAFFRTKARHLNASDSRTNGINLLLSVDWVTSSGNYHWRLSTSVIGKLADREHRTLMRRDASSEAILKVLQ